MTPIRYLLFSLIKILSAIILCTVFVFCERKTAMQSSGSELIDSLAIDTVSVNPFIDSLKAKLASSGSKERIDILNRMAEEYRNINLSYQAVLWNEALKLSEEENYTVGIADAWHNRAIGLYKQFKFDSALVCLNKSHEIAKSTGDKRVIALALSWIAEVQRASRDPKSEATYLEALKLAEQNNDHMRQAFCLTYLAALHRDKLDYETVISYCRRAIKEAEKAGYYNLVAVNNGFIGDMYKTRGESDSAKCYYEKVVDIAWTVKNYNVHAFNATNLGEIYRLEMNFSKALDYYNKALQSAEKLNDKWRLSYTNTSIGECYRELQSDYKTAKEYYYKAMKIAEESGDKKNYCFSAVTLVYALKAEKKFDEAEKIMEKVVANQKVIKDRYDEALIPEVLANLYYDEGKIEKAIEYYKIALDSAVQIKVESVKRSTLGELCRAYVKLGRFNDAAKLEKDILASISTLDNMGNVKNLSSVLAEYYFKTGNYKDAYKMHVLTARLQDSITNSAAMKKFAASEFAAKEEKLKAEQTAREAVFKEDQLKKEEELKRQKTIRYSFTIAFVLVSISLFFVFKNYRDKKRANAELEEKNDLIEKQKEIVEVKQKEILDSINYAKRIQQTLLAHDNFLQQNLPEHFVFFKPKDIVSGDFYWATKKNGTFYLSVCDSTGHGVPGAFMSLLNINFLNEAINEKNISAPNEVFNYVRQSLIQNLSQEGQKDGMDGILLSVSGNTLSYSAANNAPVLISEKRIVELPKDKMPVGIGELKEEFKTYSINAVKGDMLYLYTDGFADQFGGEKGKKFKYKPLNQLLTSISDLPLQEQKQKLDETFSNWKGDLEQVDDVCILGIRI